MNLNQIINMWMRTVMLRMINSGVNVSMNPGQNALSKRKKRAAPQDHSPRD